MQWIILCAAMIDCAERWCDCYAIGLCCNVQVEEGRCKEIMELWLSLWFSSRLSIIVSISIFIPILSLFNRLETIGRREV